MNTDDMNDKMLQGLAQDEAMDRDLLKKRIDGLTESILRAWQEFGPGVAPVLRARYGEFIVVVGIEFAKEDDD